MSKIEINEDLVELTTEEIECLVKDYRTRQNKFKELQQDCGANSIVSKLANIVENIGHDKDVDFKPYSPIFGTGFCWDVPYFIDVKKYVTCLKEYLNEIDKGPMNSVCLSGNVEFVDDDLYCYVRVIGARFSEYYFRYEFSTLTHDDPYEEFKKCVLAIVGCLVSPDVEAINKTVKENNDEIARIQTINDSLLKLIE